MVFIVAPGKGWQWTLSSSPFLFTWDSRESQIRKVPFRYWLVFGIFWVLCCGDFVCSRALFCGGTASWLFVFFLLFSVWETLSVLACPSVTTQLLLRRPSWNFPFLWHERGLKMIWYYLSDQDLGSHWFSFDFLPGVELTLTVLTIHFQPRVHFLWHPQNSVYFSLPWVWTKTLTWIKVKALPPFYDWWGYKKKTILFLRSLRTCRLICDFVVRIWHKQVFSWCGSNDVINWCHDLKRCPKWCR